MARKKRVEKVEVIPESEVVESTASEVVTESSESSDKPDTTVSDVPIPLNESTETAVTESDTVCEISSSTEAVHPEVPEEKPFRIAKIPAEYLTVEDVEPPRKKARMNSLKSRKETVSSTSEDSVVETSSDPEEVGIPSDVSGMPEPENKPLRIASMTEEQRQALESDDWFSKNARKANESRGVGSGFSKAVLKDSMKAFDVVPKCEDSSNDHDSSGDSDADYLMLHRHGVEDEPDENTFDDEDPVQEYPDEDPDDDSSRPYPDSDEDPVDLVMPYHGDTVSDVLSDRSDPTDMSRIPNLICMGMNDIPFIKKSIKPQYMNLDLDKHDVTFTVREQKHVITEMPHYTFDGMVLGCSYSRLECEDKEDSGIFDYTVFTNRGVYSFYASHEVREFLSDIATQDQLQEGFERVLNTFPVGGLEFFPVEDMDGYHEIVEDIEGVDVHCVGVIQLGDTLYGQDISMPIRFNAFVKVIVSLLNARDFESSDLSFLTAYFRAL